MDRSTISRIEEWESRSVPGGYVGLNELADAGFTGAATAGGTRLFMLNGRVVGVFDGPISTFEDGETIAYEAPDPALPLLFAMQERGGEVRGKYYTDDTPIREVDETLTSSGFTGYLELSENVLSGDYYVVYYGGRSLTAAFVGNTGRTVTGEEAFQLAADEVGIYEVRSVDLEVEDVPEPLDDAETAAAATSAAAEAPETADDDADTGDSADPETAEREEVADEDAATPDSDDEAAEAEEVGEAETETETEAETVEEAADETAGVPEGGGHLEDESDGGGDERGDESSEEPASASSGGDGEQVEDVPVEEAEPLDDDGEIDEETSPPSDSTASTPPSESTTSATPSAARDSQASHRAAGRPTESASRRPVEERREAEQEDADERFEEEARWREARTVPALDPDESESPVGRPSAEPAQEESRPPASAPSSDDADVETVREQVRRLETDLEASERERRRLNDQLEDVVGDRDDLADEREALAERIEELEARIEEAESAVAAAPSERPSTAADEATTDGTTAGRAIDSQTALDQTDLFVRYGSKAEATLQTAHDGQAGAEEVGENLRIETHSRFDTATATVGGEPFEEFLERTIQYRFVAWLIQELLYEIQETGTEPGLRALYDVLPNVDRAEFEGTVTSRDEDGNERSEEFDVVCRDRMGKPLVVANLNDSLDPATGDMMARLVEDATAAAEAHESMGAAFLVTASFFEPDALETAAEATRGGGFLSRDSKKSFVKLARNGGYHLCLVEARGDDFHVAVPEF